MSWDLVEIGKVCQVVSGATPKTSNEEFWDGDIPWVTPKNLSDLGKKFISDTPRKITNKGLKSCSAIMLPENSVLFSSRAPIGRTAINTIPLCTNQGFKSLIPNLEKIHTDFLYWWLMSHKTQIANLGRGATFKEISKSIVENIKIPLPPLPEQKRIASILDAADALRTKRRQAIVMLDELLQATFLDMFGDPVTNPKGWEVKNLGSLVDNQDGQRVPVKQSDRKRMAGKYPYYGASGIIDYVDNFLFEGERLLIGEDGANLLARSTPIAFIAKGEYWVNNHAHVLACNGKTNLVYLENLINLLDLAPYVSGSAQPKLNQKNLNLIKIIYPPLTLQTQFANIVEKVEAQKAVQQAHLAELDTLFASLQQRAFAGAL